MKYITTGRPATYSDVICRGLVLPGKQEYTSADVERLICDGWHRASAEWIVICSAAYYGARYTSTRQD